MKIKNIIIIMHFLILFFTTGLLASGTSGISGADFLELGLGSRSISMGEAYTAEINDVNSLFYNPASLATLKYPILSINHQELLIDSRLENITGAFNLFGGTMAISNTIFWVPPFEKIDIYGNSDGEVIFLNGNFSLGYGYNLGPIIVGGSLKYIYQKIDTLFLNAFAVDLGILKGFSVYSPLSAPIKNFYVGLSLLNLGTPVYTENNSYPLPRSVRLGFSYKMSKWLGFNLDFIENIMDVSDLYDFTYGFDENFKINTGIEVSYLDLLFFRGGYKFNDGGTYSFGMGANFVLKNLSVILDSSYTDSGIFGPVYSFNVSFKLIPKVITIRDRKDAEHHYNRGIRFYISNQVDEALKEFEKAKEFNPYHKTLLKKIADIEELIRLKKENEELDEKLKRKGSDKKN